MKKFVSGVIFGTLGTTTAASVLTYWYVFRPWAEVQAQLNESNTKYISALVATNRELAENIMEAGNGSSLTVLDTKSNREPNHGYA